MQATAKHPWISSATLTLIDQRSSARLAKDIFNERRIHKQIKISVKNDRSKWLNTLLQTGEWQQETKLRKGVQPKQGRLRNLSGELVSSEERADTLAEYLEKVQ